MKPSVCSIAWRSDRRSYQGPNLAAPFDELLPRIAGWGYRGIELWGPHIAHLDAAGLADLRGLLDRHDLAVPMVSSYYDFTGSADKLAESLAHGRETIARARALGAAGIRVFTGKKRGGDASPAEWEQCCQALRRLCDEAGPIILAAEIHDWNLMDTAENCERLVAAVGRPNFGLIWHPTHFGPDPLPTWLRLRQHVRHVHATNRGGGLADGTIDWRAMLAALRRDGYAGWISVEWFGEDPDGVAQREAAYLAAH